MYLDWGVLSQIKRGNHNGILNLLNDNRFIVPFSPAHIADLLSGYDGKPNTKNLINDDLKFISEITDGRFLSTSNREYILENCDPFEVFEDQLKSKKSLQFSAPKDWLNDFKELLKEFDTQEHDEDLDQAKQALKNLQSLLSTDLSSLQNLFSNQTSNQSENEQITFDFSKVETFSDLIGMVTEYWEKLEQTNLYGEVRKSLQKAAGVKRDKIFDHPNPYAILSSTPGYSEIMKSQKLGKHLPKSFDEIILEFQMLDSFGFQEDKIKTKKGRKQTITNTINDAQHSGFASFCHYFIVHDRRARKKAKQVFKKLGISTRVRTPDEFTSEFKDNSIVPNISFEELFTDWQKRIKYQQTSLDDETHFHAELPQFHLDFFNHVYFTYGSNQKLKKITLTQEGTWNRPYIYKLEINTLWKRVLHFFGASTIENREFTELLDEKSDWNFLISESELVTISFIGYSGYVSYEISITDPFENVEIVSPSSTPPTLSGSNTNKAVAR